MQTRTVRIVGYRDIFGKPEMFYRHKLAKRIGRRRLLQFTALLLTYCRRGTEPSLTELLQMFFAQKGTFDQKGYQAVLLNFKRLSIREPQYELGVLSEESLLNLYIWAADRDDISEEGNGLEDENSLSLLKIFLLFNDEVLKNFDKAKRGSYMHSDRPVLRTIFSQRFPQTDLVDIDYGRLMFAQAYKLMELLNFLEAIPKFRNLYNHLLKDFGVNSKEEFFKAIGGAALSPLNLNKPGINTMIVKDDAESKKNFEILDKLAHSAADVEEGPTDYRFLRDKPLQKVDGEYRVVFDLFLIKKLYNGLVFKLSAYAKEDKALFKGQVFGALRDEFTEAVIVYNTLNAVFDKTKTITITGNEFKKELEREPDYYCRFDKKIFLAESKDFFMPADEKLSYDFNTIMNGLSKDGRLKKAALQVATNVGRILKKELPIDKGYDPSMTIYPSVILHDSLYDCAALNYWTDEWFQGEINKMKADPEYKGCDFSVVKPLTLIDIDTLILYRTNFEKGELNLFEIIEAYQDYVDFKSASDSNYEKAIQPFSIFVEEYASKKGVIVDLKLLHETYNVSGYVDK